MRHVNDEEIDLFLSGGLEPGEFRRVLQHLASRCGICRRRLQRFAQAVFRPEPLPASSQLDESAYDAAIDRAFARALNEVPHWEEEKRQTMRALESVRRHSRLVAGVAELEEDLPAGALVHTLLELSQEARFRDPAEMLHLAFAARIAVRNLDSARYGKSFIADLQMRTWAELGNAYRVNERFDDADDAFA